MREKSAAPGVPRPRRGVVKDAGPRLRDAVRGFARRSDGRGCGLAAMANYARRP